MNAQRVTLDQFEGLRAVPTSRHYQPMNLFAPTPEVDWVVRNVVVGGEATLLVAEGGIGKSFFALALSLSVAGGEAFLDEPVQQSRVLYVDEEGSPALALQRLQQLGATTAQRENIDYLNFQNVDMVRRPGELIEDVQSSGARLVVLDSFSKIARAADENSNDAMSRVWDEGVLKLARSTNAAVLVIHHTNGYGGSRGASQIRNSADQVLTMRKQEDRSQIIYPSKPRRKTHRIHFNFRKSPLGLVYLAPVYDYEEWK